MAAANAVYELQSVDAVTDSSGEITKTFTIAPLVAVFIPSEAPKVPVNVIVSIDSNDVTLHFSHARNAKEQAANLTIVGTILGIEAAA